MPNEITVMWIHPLLREKKTNFITKFFVSVVIGCMFRGLKYDMDCNEIAKVP